MWQNAATDTLAVSVRELLPDSVLQNYSIPAADIPAIHGAQYFVWTVLLFILSCMVFREQIAEFMNWAVGFLRSPVKRTYSDTSSPVRFGLPLGFCVLLPVAAYLVYGTTSVKAPYLLVLGSLAGYYALRFLILGGISFVSGQRELVTALSRITCLFMMTATVVYCIVLIIGMFLPDLYPVLAGTVSAVIAAVLMLFYAVELLRIFFSFREPLLLTILYLCTLEILPAASAVTAILRY